MTLYFRFAQLSHLKSNLSLSLPGCTYNLEHAAADSAAPEAVSSGLADEAAAPGLVLSLLPQPRQAKPGHLPRKLPGFYRPLHVRPAHQRAARVSQLLQRVSSV